MPTEPTPGATPEQTPNDPSPATGDDSFDKDGAMALIKKLRGIEADYLKLKKSVDQRDREQLSEADRLKAEKTDLEAQIAEVRKTANQKLARASVIEAASKADFISPGLVWKTLKDDLTISDDGEVTDLGKLLAKLAADEPYLVKGGASNGATPETKPPAKPQQPSAGNPGKTPKLTVDAIAKMTPQQIAERITKDPDFLKEVEEAQRSQ